MAESSLLDGKKILIVDDEPDVLEVLEELLKMCRVEKATTFEKAKELLETQPFDMAILDIMERLWLVGDCQRKESAGGDAYRPRIQPAQLGQVDPGGGRFLHSKGRNLKDRRLPK